MNKRLLKLLTKNIGILTISFVCVSSFLIGTTLFAQNNGNIELGPDGEVPLFTQLFNQLLREDGLANPVSVEELIDSSSGAVLKSKKVFCDGTFKEVVNCSGIQSGSGGSIWQQEGNNVYQLDNKVGIGTATPNKQLHIKTEPGSNAEVNIQSGDQNYWAIYHDEILEELRFWNNDVPDNKNVLVLTNDGKVKADNICLNEDCISDWGQRAAQNCIMANSDVGVNGVNYEINLLANGQNICAGPAGCSIVTWTVYDTGADSGKPHNVTTGGWLLQLANNYWLFDADDKNEHSGLNGDNSKETLFGDIANNADCALYDDVDGIETSPDSLVLLDQDWNDQCFIRFCEN